MAESVEEVIEVYDLEEIREQQKVGNGGSSIATETIILDASDSEGTPTLADVPGDDKETKDADQEADQDREEAEIIQVVEADEPADREEPANGEEPAREEAASEYSDEDFAEYLVKPVEVVYGGERYALYSPQGPSLLDEPLTSELTLERLFGKLRGEFDDVTDSQELVFALPQLDLKITEDNIYTQDANVLDMLRLLDTCDEPHDKLVIEVSKASEDRFITRLNALFAELKELPRAKKAKLT